MLLFACMAVLARIHRLLGTKKKVTRKTVAQYEHEVLVLSTREQFQMLLNKHIKIPVVLL